MSAAPPARDGVATGQQRVALAARVHGWIANVVDGQFIYRRPGTPSWGSVMYAFDGTILWADGQTLAREPRHFSGGGKADRLVAFLAEC
ncbi:hypothetical protein R2360_13885 [Mycobacteroides chelonae]|nr:hypothetical protein [Mycobacteroides chelonae]MEC4843293.1 hypothetical protein [Mycobacteroides chelonae]